MFDLSSIIKNDDKQTQDERRLYLFIQIWNKKY